MNRLISIFACLCIMSSIVGGRELHLKTTSFEDYIPLLENACHISRPKVCISHFP